jgi:flagellar motility protein MotE (MotC chaperone)
VESIADSPIDRGAMAIQGSPRLDVVRSAVAKMDPSAAALRLDRVSTARVVEMLVNMDERAASAIIVKMADPMRILASVLSEDHTLLVAAVMATYAEEIQKRFNPSGMTPEEAAQLFIEIPVDQVSAALLLQIEQSHRAAILANIPPSQRTNLEQLMRYA